MDEYFLIFIGVISVASLLALSLFIYLLYKGNSKLLFSLQFDKKPSKWLLGLAGVSAITLLVIFYQGVMYITSWLPELFEQDGYKVTRFIALAFTFYSGFLFLDFLSGSLIWKTEAEFDDEMIRVLDKVVDDLLRPEPSEQAKLIKERLEREIEKILAENPIPNQVRLASSSGRRTQTSRRIGFYRRLAEKMDRLIAL